MSSQKYSVSQQPIETLLSWVKSGEIAIPEIQRPFVWSKTKVRDLIDSLYCGFPIGYIIIWKNPNIRLKDGSLSEGKKILIDGQQRITALTAALLSRKVLDKNYSEETIKIAFHPLEERFEVQNPAILKDKSWISDIAPILENKVDLISFVEEYVENNPGAEKKKIGRIVQNLQQIDNKPVGIIELLSDLDITVVTEIFIRINSEGVSLGEGDFAMSKISSDEKYGGIWLRKCIDYFCQGIRKPEFIGIIAEKDKEFSKTEFSQKLNWLKKESDELFRPHYSDMLRVAFTSKFSRGKLADLVSLLSGRNFETREFEEKISEDSFRKLKEGIIDFINETHFKRFVMIIKSAGFIVSDLIGSKNALNFSYSLYLNLRNSKMEDAQIEKLVRKWFVMSILTQRYSGSPESTIDLDIRNVKEKGVEKYLKEREKADLGEGFWEAGITQDLTTISTRSPVFSIYLAAQCKLNAKGFLSRDISYKEMIEHRGDIHHIFPKAFLKKKGLSRTKYNQVANFAFTQTEINIKISDDEPIKYLQKVVEQCENGKLKLGGIDDINDLKKNFKDNDIPWEILEMNFDHYEDFLEMRRSLMAKKIKRYFDAL